MTDIDLLPKEQAALCRALAASPVFRLASRYDLGRLLRVATKVILEEGQHEPICKQGEAAAHVFILLEGDFHVEGSARIDLGTRGGMTVGLAAAPSDDGKHEMTVTPTSRCAYLKLPMERVRELYWSSPPFRKALPQLGIQIGGSKRGAAAVAFTSEIPNLPIGLLLMLLGREIAESFSDRLLVVRRPGSGAPPTPQEITSGTRGSLSWVGADGVRGEWLGSYDYVFLDSGVTMEGASPPIEVALVRAARPAPEPSPPEQRRLQTVVVTPPMPACSDSLVLRNANPEELSPVDACRVYFDLEDLRRLERTFQPDTPLSTLDPRLSRSLGVWARALTLRRTGIAIGGGGVFAMQGVYVIRSLLKRGVPIDVITATSGGSLVGSYYAALGLDGLDKLVKQGDCGGLDAMVLAGMFCGAAMEGYLRCALGNRCIEHLPWAEFYPATSGLAGGTGLVAVGGPLALGVRASSSTPPLFAATITSGERLADGVFTNNLPVQALGFFNTAVTFGLNVYPPSRMPVSSCMPECVTQARSTFSILNRLATFNTAFNLLASLSGRVEGDFATTGYNATSSFDYPYLLLGNFFLSSKMVAWADNEELNAKIDEFEREWRAIQARGAPTARRPVTANIVAAPV